MKTLIGFILLAAIPTQVPIGGVRVAFANGVDCAIVVGPPDSEKERLPTYILWNGQGDKEIATLQTVFGSAYDASRYASEHCRVTPRWAKEARP